MAMRGQVDDLRAMLARIDPYHIRVQDEPRIITCARCRRGIHGKYRIFDENDICWRCAWMVGVRLRIRSARPRIGALILAAAALRDLRKARRLDPEDEQIPKNLREIRSILRSARGSWLLYHTLFLPLRPVIHLASRFK